MNLSKDIVSCILEFCSFDQLYLLFFEYKIWDKQTFSVRLLDEKIEYLKINFPKAIIELLGGIHKMILIPTLQWKDKFLGFTDYIDNIIASDVNAPIMFGKDPWNRSFITIRYIVFPNTKVITLFQRFSNDIKTWTHGSIGSPLITQSGYFLINGTICHPQFHHDIQQLVSNKPVNMNQKNLTWATNFDYGDCLQLV
jgi:hypothetical protein